MAFQPGAFQADAFQADAGFTADAVIRKTQSASFTADAMLSIVVSASFTLDAVITEDNAIFDTFQHDAFQSDAFQMDIGENRTFFANAIIRKTQSASFTADAVIVTFFTADAILRRTQSASFAADAILRATISASFTADAVIETTGTVSASFTADAVLRRTQSASFTANAWLQKVQSATLAADAVLKATITPSFTADAYIAFRVTIDAVLKATITRSFTASAWIYSPRSDPGGPGEPGETPLISIVVDGEDITKDVILSDATFTMLTNGAIGSFRFRVRDDAHVRSFTTGAEVTVDFDGKRKFGGFLSQPKRQFAFPVEDTTDPDHPSRFHVLEGVDYNILMTKRVVYHKTDPANINLRSWPAGSHDDVVIKYVFDNYTDLAADGVTYQGVEHIGSPNPDKKGVVGSGGLKFVDLMREINRLISGVFYIDQYKDLHFVDVDTPNAEFGLSDVPGVGEVGYRELAQVENGAALANDAFLWGAGLGSKLLKFSRVTDAPSVAAHGRWQYGEFTTSLFRQSSVDDRANSIVYGTPQSKRGGKDDQESWRLITFEPSFSVGQKVDISTDVFGKSDVVPIRRMTMTFPTRTSVKFDLTLSHEIDEPWNLFEFWFPRLPGIGGLPEIPDIDIPEPGDCDCGITETFSLPFDIEANDTFVEATLPVSDALIPWSGGFGSLESSGTGATASADTNSGMLHVLGTGDNYVVWQQDLSHIDSFRTGSGTITFQFKIGSTVAAYWDYQLHILGFNGVVTQIRTELIFSSDGITIANVVGGGETLSDNIPLTLDADILYNCRWERVDDNVTRARFWPDGDPEPGTWDITLDISVASKNWPTVFTFGGPSFQMYGNADSGGTIDFWIDNIDLNGQTRCNAVQFDDFERGSFVSGSWGTATSGFEWTRYITEANANGGQGGHANYLTADSGAAHPGVGFQVANVTSAPFNVSSWTMRSQISFWSGRGRLVFGVLTNGGGPSVSLTLDGNEGTNGEITGTDGNPVAFTFDPTGDTEYFVKWEVGPAGTGVDRFKVWAITDPEPGSWMHDSGAPTVDFSAALDFDVSLRNFGPDDVDISLEYIEFDHANMPCFPGGPVGGTGASTGGSGRADLTAPGGTTVFLIGSAYQPLTTRVFVDGYFKVPNVTVFESDPEAGEITFASPVTAGSLITVFYEVARV